MTDNEHLNALKPTQTQIGHCSAAWRIRLFYIPKQWPNENDTIFGKFNFYKNQQMDK